MDITVKRIQKELNGIKNKFLSVEFKDKYDGYIVEDHIHNIQNIINDYTNREFKHLEPDPFDILKEDKQC